MVSISKPFSQSQRIQFFIHKKIYADESSHFLGFDVYTARYVLIIYINFSIHYTLMMQAANLL